MDIQIIRNVYSGEPDKVYPYACPTGHDVWDTMSLEFIFTFYRKTIYDLCMAGF